MRLVQWQKQSSIKIAHCQRYDDVSTDAIHDTALCPADDTMLPARRDELHDGLLAHSSISEAGRN